MRARALLGAAALAAYVAVALLSPGGPARPLFDATGPPQPYRWVNPPPEFAPTNQPPQSASHELALGEVGSDAASIATPDGQAAIVLREGAFAARAGETRILVTIEPLDPARFGRPPSGMRYDGNAYEYVARYKKSGAEATLAQEGTVVMQFPIVATALLRRDGDAWTDLKANPVNVSQQIFSPTTKLGVFVAAGLPLPSNEPENKFPTALVVSLGSAGAAVAAGLFTRMRNRRRKLAARKKPRSKR